MSETERDNESSAPRREGAPGGRIALGVFAVLNASILLLDWIAPFSAAEPHVRSTFPLLALLVAPGGVWLIVIGVKQMRSQTR